MELRVAGVHYTERIHINQPLITIGPFFDSPCFRDSTRWPDPAETTTSAPGITANPTQHF